MTDHTALADWLRAEFDLWVAGTAGAEPSVWHTLAAAFLALPLIAPDGGPSRAGLAGLDEVNWFKDSEYKPGRWWTVLTPDGSLWCETSDGDEARKSMRPGDTLYRQWVAGPFSELRAEPVS